MQATENKELVARNRGSPASADFSVGTLGQAKEHKQPMPTMKYATRYDETETIVADWVTAKVMCDPKVNGGGMSAVSLFFDPGQGHARHNHPNNEQIIFVISGEAEMMVENEDGISVTEKIVPGSTVFIPRGAYHSTFNTGWEPVRILAVYSPPGPEAAMHDGEEFTVLPPGAVPRRKDLAKP
jgi:oxalate decarboxylase/phosphoglucose isomerase-like protein (cupin superfamily)